MNTYQVPTSAVPLLYDPPFVIWLALLAAALGRRALRWLGLTGCGHDVERAVLATVLGFGVLQYLCFGLGVARALRPGAVWLALSALTIVLARDGIAAIAAAWHFLALLRRRRRSGFVLSVAAVLCVPMLAAFLTALAPPTDPDGLYYHLTAAKRWLQSGSLDYLPTLVHTNSPMGVNMLYTLALAVWSDTAAKLIHFVFGVLALAAIVSLGRLLKSVAHGITAASLWFLGLSCVPTLDASRLFSWAYVDLALAAFTLCAVLAWLLWSRSDRHGYLIAAAICAGLAATAKLTGAFVALALAVVVSADSFQRTRDLRPALARGVLFAGIAAVPVLPWALRSLIQTGSPAYLLLPSVFQTRDWPPEAGDVFSQYFKYYVWGTGYQSLSWSLAVRKAVRAAAMAGVASGTAVLVWRDRDWEHRAILVTFAAMTVACLYSTGLYLRYLVPFLPLAFVVVLLPLAPLLERRLPQVLFLTVLAVNAVVSLSGARPAPPEVPQPSLSDVAKVALGRLSRDEFISRQIPAAPLWMYANQVVPRGAHLLLAAGRASYYIDAYCYLTEAYYQATIRMDTWEHYLADIRRNRIEYVIVDDSMAPSAPIGPDYAASRNEIPFAHRLTDESGQLLKVVATDRLYKLRR